MFHENDPRSVRGSQWAIGGLALLSLISLVVTAWILADSYREQEIVRQITRHLPASEMPEARELAGELQLHSRLAVLLILNIVASAVALTMLVRAYLSSERSLRDVKVMATDILASMDQGVITTDRHTRILSLNPRGRKLLNGIEPNGTEIALRDLPDDHGTLDEICRRVLANHHSVRDVDYVAMQNGHARNLRACCSLLRDNQQRHLGTVIHVHDVTGKTLMEQRLRRMERYMGLGSVAAGLHHEIKNPLSALSLHVQLLDEALADKPSSDVREMLDVLNTEVRRITAVLEGFRDFASISELRRTSVDVCELMRKLQRLIEPQAHQQRVSMATELPDGDPPRLSIDSVRIEQVLLNLVVNALAAMPDGGTLKLNLESASDSVRIDVGDTGCGIPDDLQDRIFDPYFTTRSTGTGMGLALSEKIVRQHNGSIDFQTGPGGTVFSVTLPRMPGP